MGLAVAAIGSSLYVFVDPSMGGLSYWLYIVGVLIIGASALIGSPTIYKTKIRRVSRHDN